MKRRKVYNDSGSVAAIDKIGQAGEELRDMKTRHAIIEHEAKMAMINQEATHLRMQHDLRMDILRNINNNVQLNSNQPLSYMNMLG